MLYTGPLNPFSHRIQFSPFQIGHGVFSMHTTVSTMAPVAGQPKRMTGSSLSICFLLACMFRGITYQTCLFTFVNVHDSTAQDHHLIFLLTIYWYLCQVNSNMRSSFFILIQQCEIGKNHLTLYCFEQTWCSQTAGYLFRNMCFPVNVPVP